MTESLQAMTGALKMTYEAMEKPRKRRVVALSEPFRERTRRYHGYCYLCEHTIYAGDMLRKVRDGSSSLTDYFAHEACYQKEA